MVLTVSFALSRGPGFLAPVAGGIITADLTPASGRQDHTTSPSAFAPPVLRRQSVHRIPHPTLMTLRNAPLSGQDGASCRNDLPDGLSEIFFSRGLDR
jgi:hypothetical protein